jgi:hypothetical protein
MAKVQKEAIEIVKSPERAHQAKEKTSPFPALKGEPATPEDGRPGGVGPAG